MVFIGLGIVFAFALAGVLLGQVSSGL